MKKNTLLKIMLIPSIYAVAVWIPLLFILGFQIITVYVSIEAYAIYFYTIICFVSSIFINYRFTKGLVVSKIAGRIQFQTIDKIFLIFFILVGGFGIFIYIIDFAKYLGGESFFIIFFINPLLIREIAAQETSLGFQLSYLTWPIIPYFIFLLKKSSPSNCKKFILLTGIIACFFVNTLFIDRTRPVLLLIGGVLAYFIFFNDHISSPLKITLLIIVGPIAIFFGQAFFTGKYDARDGLINNFLVYLLGGFGYFSAALEDSINGISVANTFMPIVKILHSAELAPPAPNQILDFRTVPFETNVGTFLQPLVADGGWWMVVLLLPMLIFTLDYIALVAFNSNTLFGIFIWSHIVSLSLLSFFVPKYNSTHLYLFIFLLIIYMINFKNIFIKCRK